MAMILSHRSVEKRGPAWRAFHLSLRWYLYGTQRNYSNRRYNCKCLIRLARPEGFEPPTPKFVVWCSIQLSYGR